MVEFLSIVIPALFAVIFSVLYGISVGHRLEKQKRKTKHG